MRIWNIQIERNALEYTPLYIKHIRTHTVIQSVSQSESHSLFLHNTLQLSRQISLMYACLLHNVHNFKCRNVYKDREMRQCIDPLAAFYEPCSDDILLCARLRGCCHRFNIVCMPSYNYIRFLLHSLDFRSVFSIVSSFLCLLFVCLIGHFEMIFDDMQFHIFGTHTHEKNVSYWQIFVFD